MAQEKITSDSIIAFLKKAVENQSAVLDPKLYLNAAMKLAILLGDETGKLAQLRMEVAQKKLFVLGGQDKRNVAAAEIEVEASTLYMEMKKQEAKVDQIEEMIRIAKLQSRSEGNF